MRKITVQRIMGSLTAAAAFLAVSCTQLKKPEPEPYFAETPAPPKQELRWSNGRSPKSLDPAKAASAPETDVVRALYEGLTDLDPQSLEAVPAVAERWEPSEDKRTWRFYLRETAVWSNGKRVTAEDFVRSIKRLAEPETEAAHRELLTNFRGLNPEPKVSGSPDTPSTDANSNVAANTSTSPTPSPSTSPSAAEEGVVAESASILRIDLTYPDKDLPKLLAHPIFRPQYRSQDKADPKSPPITNGPFKVTSFDPESLILDRSDTYWGSGSVKLERVAFIAAATPDKALEAYREGKIDVVTNAEFAPAALKLLEPYQDFRRVTHNAINLYEFNTSRTPFNDRRVRQALSLAIEREDITEGELQGTTRPADGFLPAGGKTERRLSSDVQRAQALLDEAGFADGVGFPAIQLVINRNDTQQRIAKAVAAMWKANLGVDTNIIVREPAEFEAARTSGAFDLIRKGFVMPTADETMNMLSIFGLIGQPAPEPSASLDPRVEFRRESGPAAAATESNEPDIASSSAEPPPILNEEEALYELRAIPLYFPTSYVLVKPYVKGFQLNALDAPSLKSVEIDSNWRTR